ncbi:Zinc finger and SCAN domain-containing protein 2 [Orchesella cincta]|uniref:Zinc finger and SCAN domain-containing protein 2 n=1 Tax=Orchesella cincta TaxID=48709 RepID=A0A1D2MGK6_ORCCI|nr:Zinc finger and SCAN domain-containing protein 2 [Orchesella cincta]
MNREVVALTGEPGAQLSAQQQLQQLQQGQVAQMLPGGTLISQPAAQAANPTQQLVNQIQGVQQQPQQLNNNPVEVTETARGTELLAFFKKFREREKYCDVVLHTEIGFTLEDKSKVTPASTLSGAAKHWARCNKYGEWICEKVLVLKTYCAQYLERFLDCENCLQMKEIGEKFNVQSLAKGATTFVQTHLAEVINHEVMMELSPKQVESFVTEKAWSIPQETAVKFMSRWVYHDQINRERDFKQLLLNMEWTTMDPNVIVEFIDQEPLFGTSERSFYYVLHSLAEKGIQVQKYEEIYQALQQRFGQEPDQPLGLNDNLLQMAFNSAMEGLQPPPNSVLGEKWGNENDPSSGRKKVRKLTLEQRRKKILAKIQRNRAIRKWVTVRLDRPRSWKLGENEIVADSSGDEECDPIQTDGSYRCHICPFFTKKVSRLEKHLASIHAHDVTYRCSECSFTCKWNREYFLHMKTHFDGPAYKCSNCEFSCNKIGTLIAHKIAHVDLKPYSCPECEFRSRTKSNLAVHLKTHNNEKPYRCGICGRNFASKNSLDQHSVGHNTDKTYACTQCPFSTKYLNHFTNHKKSHHLAGKKGRELYKCQDASCKYTTNKKSQLDSHMRSHAGVRPHVCGICGRRFLEKSHLVRHERIHFNERPFKCEECDYASTRRDKLKEHKSRHHGANASAKSPYKPRPHKGGSNKSGGSEQSQQQTTSTQQQQPAQQQQVQVQQQTVVYAKKSPASANQQQQQQIQAQQLQQQQLQQQQQQQEIVTTAGGEMEFILPQSLIPSSTDSSGTTTYAQISGASALDLQQLANAGVVQLRQFQTTSQSGPVVAPAVSSSPLDVQFVTSTGTARKSGKSRIILVQNKPDMQAGQTLTSGSMTVQDLQRLGLKLEDLQGQGIIGIQQGGTTRAIKLEDLTGGNVQVSQAVNNTQGAAQGMTSGVRIQHQGATMILDANQLQQLAQAAAAATGNSAFERGIPITISTQGGTSINSTGITVNTQQISTNRGGQQTTDNQTGDFTGISNLFG